MRVACPSELAIPSLRDGVSIVGFHVHGDIVIPSLRDGVVTVLEIAAPRRTADSLQAAFDGIAR
jgi:hypothetical protein